MIRFLLCCLCCAAVMSCVSQEAQAAIKRSDRARPRIDSALDSYGSDTLKHMYPVVSGSTKMIDDDRLGGFFRLVRRTDDNQFFIEAVKETNRMMDKREKSGVRW